MAINVLSEQGFSASRFGHEIRRSKSHMHQKKALDDFLHLINSRSDIKRTLSRISRKALLFYPYCQLTLMNVPD